MSSLSQFIANVRDQRVNEKFDNATVIVNVVRNNFIPTFVDQPYLFGLSENTAVGTSVYRVSAVDQDLSAAVSSISGTTFLKRSKIHWCIN